MQLRLRYLLQQVRVWAVRPVRACGSPLPAVLQRQPLAMQQAAVEQAPQPSGQMVQPPMVPFTEVRPSGTHFTFPGRTARESSQRDVDWEFLLCSAALKRKLARASVARRTLLLSLQRAAVCGLFWVEQA